MQLIWLSSPTSKVVTLSIGRRTVVWAVLFVASFLIVMGSLLQLMGIRVAIDVRPDLARVLGGVTSQSEHDRIASQYEEQITQLKTKVQSLSGKVKELEQTKKSIVELVPARAPSRVSLGNLTGMGGPLRSLMEFDWFAPGAIDAIRDVDKESQVLEQQIANLGAAWQRELEIIESLPLRPPMVVDHRLSSGFGTRRDPFTGEASRHEGLDFVAPYGSPIVATAPGRVALAQYFGPYGRTVDVDHGRGFTTRYAHMSKINVQIGDRVQAGDVLGLLGNTGRSTGPHLHYEVRFQGRPINPVPQHVLTAAQRNVNERGFFAQRER
jgi:murein DD-endopeptidase MepM/ murein hydrolase activator NlpD